MKRLFSIVTVLLLVGCATVFIQLRPMSVNFAEYLLWKFSAAAPQSAYIEHGGARIHYAAYGQGQPLLLLHGGLSSKLCWFSQLPWLAQAGRQVVLIDTRGHGYSSRGPAELSYQVFAEDVLRVMDSLHIARADMIGWSDGGVTALMLGLQAPQRVGRIIAISANFHPGGLLDEPVAGTGDQADFGWPDSVKTWFQSWWSGAGDRHAELEAELNRLWRTQPQLAHSDLRAITAPTLVIAGENDIIDIAHSGELAQMLAHGRIEIVLGAGHTALFTHPRQINRLIADFLDIPLS
ncbi:MAG: alpha/beta hydrolase [Methylomonas sp.]|jgi:pimeloyl-ACP methyl ester carboxylesterase